MKIASSNEFQLLFAVGPMLDRYSYHFRSKRLTSKYKATLLHIASSNELALLFAVSPNARPILLSFSLLKIDKWVEEEQMNITISNEF